MVTTIKDFCIVNGIEWFPIYLILVEGKNEKLENLLSNNQKFTSPLRLRSSLKPFFNTKLSFLSLDLTEKFLSFYPNEKTSAKIFCEAIKSVIAK